MNRIPEAIEAIVRSKVAVALPLVSWCLFIFGISSVPGNQYPKVDFPHADKLVHFHLYLLGGLAASLCFSRYSSRLAVPAMFAMVYGLTDEIHQLWVPFRSFSLLDLFADAMGAVAGVLLFASYLNQFHLPYYASRGEVSTLHHLHRMETP